MRITPASDGALPWWGCEPVGCSWRCRGDESQLARRAPPVRGAFSCPDTIFRRGPVSENTSQPGSRPAQGMGDEPLPFRYGARMAGEIEARWQDRWEADGTFHAPNPAGPLAGGFDRMAGRPKFMIMDMFPYPSGAGLHVGHPL